MKNLDLVVDEVSRLNTKLILLVGGDEFQRAELLRELGQSRKIPVLELGLPLGRALLSVAGNRRHLRVSELVRALAEASARDNLLLLGRIEILFDKTLALDPLDMLKRLAHVRRVVAVWPGEFRANRLTYAVAGNPEYQDYSLEGVVPFVIQ